VLRPKVRNGCEDFGRDPVDWCGPVPPEPNQAEDLESFLLENVELIGNMHQSQSLRPIRSFVRLTSAISGVAVVLQTWISASAATHFTAPDVPCVNSHILQEFLGCSQVLK
jgi:hypothetical protein